MGRFSAEKRIHELIDVVEQYPEIGLALIGDGPDKALKERVASVYQHVDAFLIASTSETCGLSAPEALASGLPIVVPHAQGLRDLVQHEEHALRRRLSERTGQFGQMHTSRSATDWLIALYEAVIQQRQSLKTRRCS